MASTKLMDPSLLDFQPKIVIINKTTNDSVSEQLEGYLTEVVVTLNQLHQTREAQQKELNSVISANIEKYNTHHTNLLNFREKLEALKNETGFVDNLLSNAKQVLTQFDAEMKDLREQIKIISKNRSTWQ